MQIRAMKFRTFDEQVSRNRDSRSRWIEYGTHRTRVTQLIARQAPQGGRLLLLGAGNCNDVDLQTLIGTFSEIHLVDFDMEALRWGIAQQGLASHPQLILYGGIDVTGIGGICSSWDPDTPANDEQLGHAIQIAQNSNLPDLRTQFDVVASVGLLSQLVDTIVKSLGERHPRFLELLSVMRLRHLQILLESLRVGGRMLLVTEIVSSNTSPELLQVSENDLQGLLIQLINARNFFTGLNPVVLAAICRESPDLAPLVEQVELSPPWLWNFGPWVYACCALSGVRRANASR